MKTWQRLKAHPELWERYFVRERTIRSIRHFFDSQQFHEVETPILIAHPPAESYLDVFKTTLLNRQRRANDAYLSTSPEVPLKKLMVAGLGNCYAVTKSFRNMETQGNLHNPEFTILEWYRVGSDYKDIMNDCEELVLRLLSVIPASEPESALKRKMDSRPRLDRGQALRGNDRILKYQGQTIDLTPPWERQIQVLLSM